MVVGWNIPGFVWMARDGHIYITLMQGLAGTENSSSFSFVMESSAKTAQMRNNKAILAEVLCLSATPIFLSQKARTAGMMLIQMILTFGPKLQAKRNLLRFGKISAIC
jgi:hypothetical protein